MTSTISTETVGAGGDRPRDLTAEDFALMTGEASRDGVAAAGKAPSMAPPQAGAGSEQAGGTISGKKVLALWSNAADRNAWAYLADTGWKKLSPASDSGNGNLGRLAASARETGSAPYVVDDAAGVVTAMYVW